MSSARYSMMILTPSIKCVCSNGGLSHRSGVFDACVLLCSKPQRRSPAHMRIHWNSDCPSWLTWSCTTAATLPDQLWSSSTRLRSGISATASLSPLLLLFWVQTFKMLLCSVSLLWFFSNLCPCSWHLLVERREPRCLFTPWSWVTLLELGPLRLWVGLAHAHTFPSNNWKLPF